MDKSKHYYWRHKKNGKLLMNNTAVGDGPFLASDEPFLVSGKNTRSMDYVPAWLTPSEMVDLGFNIYYFEAEEVKPHVIHIDHGDMFISDDEDFN